MIAETVQLTLNVEKSKFPAFMEMLKLFEFVRVETWDTMFDDEEDEIVGYEADGTPVTESDLVASALEALEDKKLGRLVPVRELLAQPE